MMTQHYWAVRPARMELKYTRIERAPDAVTAVAQAFGRVPALASKLAVVYVGTWLVKDLGTSVAALRIDKRRIGLLEAADGWFDPYKEAR